jgi:K+-sensing histidine kinase KdpD
MSRALFGQPGIRHGERRLIAVAAPIVLPLGVAVCLIPLRGRIPNATIALVLAAIVTLVASAGTRATAALAAISASVGFDVVHTPPYGSVTFNRGQDLEVTALLLVVGLIVGQLAAANRRHRHLAGQSSHALGRIHMVAEMVAAGDPADDVAQVVADELTAHFGLVSCRYDQAFAERPGPFIERHGAVTWGAIQWDLARWGLPSQDISLMIEHQGRPLGRYVLLAAPGTRATEDQLLAAVALADQAGAALAAQTKST